MTSPRMFDDHVPGSIHQQLRLTGAALYNLVRFFALPWEMIFHERFGIRYVTYLGMHGIQMALAWLTVLDYTGLFRWFGGIATAPAFLLSLAYIIRGIWLRVEMSRMKEKDEVHPWDSGTPWLPLSPRESILRRVWEPGIAVTLSILWWSLLDTPTGVLLFISANVLGFKSLWEWLSFRNVMLDIVGNEQDVDDLPGRIRRWKKEKDNLVTIAGDIPPIGIRQKQPSIEEMTERLDPALRSLIEKSG